MDTTVCAAHGTVTKTTESNVEAHELDWLAVLG